MGSGVIFGGQLRANTGTEVAVRTSNVPRRKRNSTAGLTFHVVNRAAKRTVLFENASDYAAFERVLEAAVRRSRVAVFAYCIMPNHWHFLLSPLADGALSVFMHWLTTTHARRWQTARALDGQGAVYQGRFKAVAVSNDRHFLWVCRYIERNPLRAALVERAECWRWSSLHFYNEPSTWLAEWPIERPADWLSQVNTPQTEAELDAFRTAMRQGVPFGSAAWTATMMSALAAKPLRKRGRPQKSIEKCPRKMTPDPIFTGG
jgi:REP-associated tyrosine transposase